jgi:hypothetical protein
MSQLKTRMALGLGAAGAMGMGLGCAALIGLSPADPPPACTDMPDQTALGENQATFVAKLVDCSVSTSDNLSGASACIRQDAGISKPCADCFAANGACTNPECGGVCLGHTESPSCQTCIAASPCNAALITCGGTPVFACADPTDTAAMEKYAATFEQDLQMCGGDWTDSNTVVACIRQQVGLTQPCALCYAQAGLCAANQCSMCAGDSTTTECVSCVGSKCTPVLTLCSGISVDGGPDGSE